MSRIDMFESDYHEPFNEDDLFEVYKPTIEYDKNDDLYLCDPLTPHCASLEQGGGSSNIEDVKGYVVEILPKTLTTNSSHRWTIISSVFSKLRCRWTQLTTEPLMVAATGTSIMALLCGLQATKPQAEELTKSFKKGTEDTVNGAINRFLDASKNEDRYFIDLYLKKSADPRLAKRYGTPGPYSR